jgi:hypothetical protein
MIPGTGRTMAGDIERSLHLRFAIYRASAAPFLKYAD